MDYMCFSTTLWVKYALIKGDSTMLYANSIGSVLTLTYCSLYYFYTLQKVALTYPRLLCEVILPISYPSSHFLDCSSSLHCRVLYFPPWC